MTDEFKYVRPFNNIDSPIYPLIFKRKVSSYKHIACMFDVNKNHDKYNSLKDHIQKWFKELPSTKSSCVIDFTKTIDYSELSPSSWYVVDLRKNKDVWTNEIKMLNIDKVTEDIKSRICFELYENVKGIVLFVDVIDQVPKSLATLSCIGLSDKTGNDLASFITKGCNKTPNSAIPLNKNTNTLCGYNRFEDQPIFVAF